MNNNNFQINFKTTDVVSKTAKKIKSSTSKVLEILKQPKINLIHKDILEILAQCYGYINYTHLSRNLNPNEPQISTLDDDKKIILYNSYEIELEKKFSSLISDEYRLLVIKTVVQYFKYQYTAIKNSNFYSSYEDIAKKFAISIPKVVQILEENELVLNNYPTKFSLEYEKVYPVLLEEKEKNKKIIKFYWDNTVINTLFTQTSISIQIPKKALLFPLNIGDAQNKLNKIAEGMFGLYEGILWVPQEDEEELGEDMKVRILYPITMELTAWNNVDETRNLFSPFLKEKDKLSKIKLSEFNKYTIRLETVLNWIEQWQKKNKGGY